MNLDINLDPMPFYYLLRWLGFEWTEMHHDSWTNPKDEDPEPNNIKDADRKNGKKTAPSMSWTIGF